MGLWGVASEHPLLASTFKKKWHFWRKFWCFWPKYYILEVNFCDHLGFSQIWREIFKKLWPLPPPLKIFLNPYPPPKILCRLMYAFNSVLKDPKTLLKIVPKNCNLFSLFLLILAEVFSARDRFSGALSSAVDKVECGKSDGEGGGQTYFLGSPVKRHLRFSS